MNSAALLAGLAVYVRTGEANVPSPCVSVCRMDPARDQCEGCFRRLNEIAAWSRMDDEGKRAVWLLIEQRAGLVQA